MNDAISKLFPAQSTYPSGLAFSQKELENYYIDYVPVQGSKGLFIVFENANPTNKHDDPNREAWGVDELYSQKMAVIGVKPKGLNWYRPADLHEFLRDPDFVALTKQYGQIYLYGGSMGGFAALTFSSLFPGSVVLAYNPQSTLNPEIVDWENRFRNAQNRQDWSGDFADAAEGLNGICKAYVVYDPLFPMDRKHVMRLPQDNLVHLKVPFVEHMMPYHVLQLGMLKDVVEHTINGTVEAWFPKAARARKQYPVYKALGYLKVAERYYKAGSFDKAIEKVNQAIDIISSEQSYNFLGLAPRFERVLGQLKAVSEKQSSDQVASGA